MEPETRDWRTEAFEIYRLAWSEVLDKWKGSQREELAYFVEELREALLDLKQATIQDDPLRALKSIDEVLLLLAELRWLVEWIKSCHTVVQSQLPSPLE